MKTWFTSDTHFGHANIIKYCKRPFKNVEHMNEILINNWNSRVKPNDLVIHLGDFAFKESTKIKEHLAKLNGHITFIRGNHDNNNSLDTRILDVTMNLGRKTFYCIHDPKHVNVNFKYALVGHIHGNWLTNYKEMNKKKTLCVNVGVDVWNYHPVSINEILKVIASERKRSKVSNTKKGRNEK